MKAPLVIVTHEFFPKRGGIAIYAEETARAAVKLGWETQVWAPVHKELMDQSWPFEVTPLPIRGNLGWPDRRRCMKALIRNREFLNEAELILPEPGPILAAMYLEAMGQLPGGRISLILHGSEILRCAHLPHRRTLFAGLLKRAASIGVVSRYTQRLLLRYYPFVADKVHVVSGGLRTDFIPVEKTLRDTQRCVVLSVGRLHPRKGQHCLVEAAALLHDSIKSRLTLRLAGPTSKTDYVARLQTLAAASGVTVEFHGEVPDAELPRLYADADVFAITSLRTGPSVEGFGLVAIEAGAAGLPVLAHRSGGIPEAVINNQTGLIVGPAKREALKVALERLVSHPALRQRLGEAGKVRAAELSWERNVEALLA